MPEYNIIIDKINYTAQNGFHTVQTAKLHGGGNGSKMSEGIYLSTVFSVKVAFLRNYSRKLMISFLMLSDNVLVRTAL